MYGFFGQLPFDPFLSKRICICPTLVQSICDLLNHAGEKNIKIYCCFFVNMHLIHLHSTDSHSTPLLSAYFQEEELRAEDWDAQCFFPGLAAGGEGGEAEVSA